MRNFVHGLFLVPAFLLIVSCAATEPNLPTLTPTMLRSSLDEFNGKVVTVVAWVTLESENANLWSSAEDMRSSRTVHCVSLENFDRFWAQRGQLTRRRVMVTGLFRKDVVLDSGTLRFAACSNSAIEPTSITIM